MPRTVSSGVPGGADLAVVIAGLEKAAQAGSAWRAFATQTAIGLAVQRTGRYSTRFGNSLPRNRQTR